MSQKRNKLEDFEKKTPKESERTYFEPAFFYSLALEYF